MGDTFFENLFYKQEKQFEKINDLSKAFAVNYCGNTIIRESIFGIVSNYARKRELALEVLRYPFRDDELWAFTFVKKGTIFLCVNTELPMCKQIFATAHELYHIHCYAEDINTSTITSGSLLDSKTVDEVAATQEDLEEQWQQNSGSLLRYGSLLDNLAFNSEHELLVDSREESDRAYLEKIRKEFRNRK